MNGRNLFTTAELVTIRELLKRLRNRKEFEIVSEKSDFI